VRLVLHPLLVPERRLAAVEGHGHVRGPLVPQHVDEHGGEAVDRVARLAGGGGEVLYRRPEEGSGGPGGPSQQPRPGPLDLAVAPWPGRWPASWPGARGVACRVSGVATTKSWWRRGPGGRPPRLPFTGRAARAGGPGGPGLRTSGDRSVPRAATRHAARADGYR